MFRSVDGACCESWRATDGGRCDGGCKSDELILTAYGAEETKLMCRYARRFVSAHSISCDNVRGLPEISRALCLI